MTRADLGWWVAIVLVAAAVRVVFNLQYADYPLATDLEMDEAIHHEWALANLRGEPFWDGAYFRAPLYIWFLTGVYALFGPNPLAARMVQSALGALTCGLAFWVGRRAFGRAVGVASGFVSATYWTLVYFDAQLMIPVLISFLDLGLLWLLLWTYGRPRPGRWALCGLALGLSAIARPNVLLFAPFLVLWQLWILRPQWGRFLGHAACLTAGTLAPILPVTARNAVAGGDLSLICTQGGVNWYIGNNPGSDGMTAILPGDPADWWRCYEAQIERAEADLGRELRGSEVSQYYARRTLEFWSDEPRAALALTLKKLGLFWTRFEIANAQDINLVTEVFTPVVRWLPVGFWLVGPLGVLGWLLAVRAGARLFPLWGFVPVYMCSVVAFFVTARYRIPVVHVLVPLSVFAVQWTFRAARGRRWGALLGAALVVGAMAWVGARRPAAPEVWRIQGLRTIGLVYAEQGRYERAESFLAEATATTDRLGLKPRARIWFYLGLARHAQGDLEGARAAYERALAIRERFRELRYRLAQVYRDLGRTADAEREFRAAIERDPEHVEPRVELARLLLASGRAADALAALEPAPDAVAADARVLFQKARCLAALGRRERAAAAARQGLERAGEQGLGELLAPLRRLQSQL